MEGLSRKRVREFQAKRVQKDSLSRASAVQFVAKNRKALLAKMNAYLVCAARKQLGLNQKAAALFL